MNKRGNDMQTKKKHVQQSMAFTIEEIVPKDHLLRKIDKAIDFGFIYKYTESLYSTIGRPSIDPVVLFKIALINHLYGYNSMRRTISEVQVNLAYRWFLGLEMYDKVPHFSDFSSNYKRRFQTKIEYTDRNGVLSEKTIFEIIFEEILNQAYEKKFIYPGHVYMDSTHIKANANKKKIITEAIQEELRDYQAALDKEIDEECTRLGLNIPKSIDTKEKVVKKSEIDPEAGVFFKGEHEKQIAYLAQTCSDINGFVLGVDINPANLHDSTTFSKLYEEMVEKFGVGGERGIRSIGLDAGFKTPAVCREVIETGVTPLLPYTAPKGKRHNEENAIKMGKKDFTYDKSQDVFICPNNQVLTPRGIDRKTGYINYSTSTKQCATCPFRAKCLSKSSKVKTLVRHIWQKYLDEAELIRHTEYHAKYYPMRSKTIERVFADGKEKHGLRFTRYKGIQRVTDETLLIFACMNMKKTAIWTS